MTSADVPDGGAAPAPSGLERLTGAIAIVGGLLALGVACLVTASVLRRWLLNSPIDGDFEFVKMVTAVAVFAYLPYTQARRGNIMVDTFTGWLPAGARHALDAFWDLVYAAFVGYVAYCLVFGSLDAIRTGETTMQRQLLIWPSIALSTALCMLLALTAIVTAVHLLAPRTPEGAR